MRKKKLFALIILVLPLARVASAIDSQQAQAFAGQDLHLRGTKLLSHQTSTNEYTLVFQDGFSMSIGANQLFSDKAVVWLESITTEFRGRIHINYNAQAYLAGNLSVKKGKGAQTVDLSQMPIEEGQSMFVRFGVSGEVFVTADERELGDPGRLELYKRALAASGSIETGPKFVIQPGVLVPEYPQLEKEHLERAKLPAEKTEPRPSEAAAAAEPTKPDLVEQMLERQKRARPEPAEVTARPQAKELRFRYPVNMAPAGERAPRIESAKAADGTDIATVIGRLYVWQKSDEKGGLLELQADNTVIFRHRPLADEEEVQSEDILAGAPVRAVYMSGDVVMTEGQRTIRADEIYYDFQEKKGLAVNAVMRNFDVSRGIPIYVRAAKLRQLAENKFAAENITLTSSEFYLPQISVNASKVLVTDTTTIDEQMGKLSDSSYDAEMHDVRLKMGKKTIFYWPFMRSNLQRPDVPLENVRLGHDNTWGTSIETRWYLSRLLGLREPEGTDGTFALDYYSKRGLGSGVEIDYKRQSYFGKLSGYLIHDTGKDRLGRDRSRKDLEPPRKLRGRFQWLHKHFLPYNWQLATGISYASDEHFLEQYYRGEFNTGLEQETFIHLKRIEDNWALAFLGKARINDFADELEELPGAEFHLTGQSLFNDRFTLYSNTAVGRRRQRISNEHSIPISDDYFSFVSHRTELDMPVKMGSFKIVPFVAKTSGYDDRSGFTRSLVDGNYTGSFGEDKVQIIEAGVRVGTQYWKVYPDVKSRLWDLNQLRHIIKPHLTAILYDESDSVVEQRDILNVGISQRLQTKRGPVGETRTQTQNSVLGGTDVQRSVDWMRLDMDFTWVDDSSHDAASSGPDRFIWNRPAVPLRVLSAPDIFNSDLSSSLQRFEMFGPRRNYIGADYIWRISDTSAVLSDMNFDMQSGTVQQLNFGFAGLRWPNLSYYIGSRYLRRVELLDEKGSNAFVFAATYTLDPRYTVVFSQQFDFDYGANIRSDITLIRRYHRMYCGFTYSADESLDRRAIVFSIWPQGVPEMAIGRNRYMGLGNSAGY